MGNRTDQAPLVLRGGQSDTQVLSKASGTCRAGGGEARATVGVRHEKATAALLPCTAVEQNKARPLDPRAPGLLDPWTGCGAAGQVLSGWAGPGLTVTAGDTNMVLAC